MRSTVMKLSRNGQVSLPAEARRRWGAERMLVVDMGDYLVMRPLPADPVGALFGKYAGGQSADEARQQDRDDDAAAEARRTG